MTASLEKQHRVTWRGEERTIASWVAELEASVPGLSCDVVRCRLKYGWDVEKALTTPNVCAMRRKRAREEPRFADDPAAIAFVEKNPGGGSLADVAAFFGFTRQRIQQIEAQALRNLGRRLALAGISELEVLEMLSEKPDSNSYAEADT